MIINLEQYGNTTAATIPLALADAVRQKRLKKGDLVLLASVGAGFTVGRGAAALGDLEAGLGIRSDRTGTTGLGTGDPGSRIDRQR